MSKWIPVMERLPEESCLCLCVTKVGGIYLLEYSNMHKAFNANDGEDGDKYAMLTVTHWMPLPELPETEV